MGAGLTIEVSNQDYDIDVVLESTVFINSEIIEQEGFIKAAGTPVANQIAVFTTPAIIRGYANLTYDGSSFNTPLIKVDHIAENGLDHGIVFDHQVHVNSQKNIGTFSSGFTGQGHKLEYTGGLSSLTLDNLTVRRRMSVYELEIREINHIGGSILVSVADGIVTSYTGTGPYNLYFDTKNNANPITFVIGDYVRAQIWDGTGLLYFEGQVTDKQSDYITVTSTDTPWEGMKLCQFGHPTNADRQNIIYITAADDNNPYISGLAGVTDGLFDDHEVFRLGNLSGIDDVDFGPLTGFGLYAGNVYLKGKIQIAAGSTGYGSITDRPDSLADINNTEYTSLGQAITDSGNAITAVTEISTDSKVTPSEKFKVLPLWEQIVTEGNPTTGTIVVEADALSVSTTAFDTAYSNLDTYLNTTLNVFGNMGVTTNITRSQWDGYWKAYYSARIALLTAIADKASILADWATVANRPAYILAPSGTGLFIDGTHLGYYTGGQWTTYMDNEGNFSLGDYTAAAGLYWNQATGVLNIKGAINVTSVSGLATIASTGSWSDIQSMPGRFSFNSGSPPGAGLYLGSTYMGYYNGGSWTAYIDSSGNSRFVGVTEIGTQTLSYGGKLSNVAIQNADIWENSYNGDNSAIHINRLGYNGGATTYRDFVVYDGKAHKVFQVGNDVTYCYVTMGNNTDPITAQVQIYGTLTVSGAVVFNGTIECNQIVDFDHEAHFNSTARFYQNVRLSGAATSYTTVIEHPVSIGPNTPNSYACLDLGAGKRGSGDPGALIIPKMTTAQRNALTAVAGMMVYDTDLGSGVGRLLMYLDQWRIIDWQ